MISEYIPQVVQVLAGKEYQVYAWFDDGSVHLYDMSPLLKPGTVFEPLLDKVLFRKSLTVMNDTLAFDLTGNRDPYDVIDIAPEEIYSAKAVKDPLKGIACSKINFSSRQN